MDARLQIDRFKKALSVSTDQEFANILQTSKANVDSWIKRNNIPDKWIFILKEKQKQLLHVKTISIPKLELSASCGGGNNLESIDSFEVKGELIIDADTLKVANGKLKAIKVEGYSMMPTLLPESWVVFNEHGEYSGEGLYVLNWRNILMVKLLQINAEGKLRIISTNKDYESYTLDVDDQSVFKIIGKVVRTII